MSNEGTEALLALGREILAELRGLRQDRATARPAPSHGGGGQRATGGTGGGTVTTFPKYGNNAGGEIRGAKAGDLEFYGSRARRGMAEKTGWKADNDRALVAAIDAEIARQNASPVQEAALEFGSPPPDDDMGIPF